MAEMSSRGLSPGSSERQAPPVAGYVLPIGWEGAAPWIPGTEPGMTAVEFTDG
jgi:hypothetical protein